MKKCILNIIAVILCALALCSTMFAPVYAYAPPDDDGGISTCAEVVRWYFRTNNGVEEMRLWSVTQGRWLTDWVPCPEQP